MSRIIDWIRALDIIGFACFSIYSKQILFRTDSFYRRAGLDNIMENKNGQHFVSDWPCFKAT